MSNGDEVTRKSHIKRIYKDDDPDSGQWVDIERLDELLFVSKRQFPWREKRWKFDWDNFDPGGDNVTKKKIKQHKDDDDSSAIEVPVRDMVFVTEGREQQFQGYRHYFVNTDKNSSRKTHSRRVYHYEVPDDKLDGDGNPPRDPRDYLNVLADKNDGQYVEVEILDRYWTNEHETRDGQGNIKPSTWQEKKWVLDSSVDPLLTDPAGDTSKDGATINPDAGPQVDPPYRLDPLQNIVNVQWGGGVVFVYGTLTDDALYYVRISGKSATSATRKTIKLPGHGDPKNGFSAYGSSYHLVITDKDTDQEKRTPTFVVCGNGATVTDTGTGHLIAFNTRVFYSRDGLRWETVYSHDGHPTADDPTPGANSAALVWDPDDEAFYYDQNDQKSAGAGLVDTTDQIFKSESGKDWGLDSSTPTTDAGSGYRSSFDNHCTHNDCLDGIGQHVPDEVMSYDRNLKLTAKPKKPPIIDYAQGLSSVAVSTSGETVGGSEVVIVKETQDGKQTSTVSIPGLKKVFCVAGVNGILMAGGSPDLDGSTGAVVLSTDNGETWNEFDRRESSVITMVAASTSDIPDKQAAE